MTLRRACSCLAESNPSAHHKTCIKFGGPSAIYLVQELNARADEEQCITAPVLDTLVMGMLPIRQTRRGKDHERSEQKLMSQ
jgi:hypothetical protein